MPNLGVNIGHTSAGAATAVAILFFYSTTSEIRGASFGLTVV